MNAIPIHSKINPNMHPDSIPGSSQGVKSAKFALGTLYVAAGKIHDLHDVVKGRAIVQQRQMMAAMPRPADGRKKVAPALILDQHAANYIIDVGTPLATAALKAADVAIATITDQVKHLDTAIDQKIVAGKNPARGSELRLWAAKQDSPFIALGPLFQDAGNNQTLVAEVLLGEHFLSGISASNKAALRSVAANVLAQDEVQDRKETAVALVQLTAAAKSFTESTAGIFNSLRSPVEGVINSIVKEGGE